MSKKMTESQVMALLVKLENEWPDGFQLYAQSGTLMLVTEGDNALIDTYKIPCDGGDIGVETGDDGIERLAFSDSVAGPPPTGGIESEE